MNERTVRHPVPPRAAAVAAVAMFLVALSPARAGAHPPAHRAGPGATHVLECAWNVDTVQETGTATCLNSGDSAGRFRAQVLCDGGLNGWSPWVEVEPGATRSAVARCAPGPGGPVAVAIEHRPA
ncbi:hypothetical protein ACLGI4_27155 [Streptomyces sp. HMX112]|uniref:hypothetical protein n=1 Tax=Streptomyces sp. HMX112 TaxID=3390850 RepID=UPI003A812898